MRNKYWGGPNFKNNMEVGVIPPSPQEQMREASEGIPPQILPEIIKVVENKIYFYADIDRQNVLELNKTLDTLNNDLLYKSSIQKSKKPEIYLFINSYGGNIFDAFSVMDTMLNSEIKINTIIDGCAASAATLLSVVGHSRYIKKHSYFLIHQISSLMWGKYSEFKDEMENLDRFMKMLKDIYKEHTKLPMNKLAEILKHDLWFDSTDALNFGLVDEIYNAEKIGAGK